MRQIKEKDAKLRPLPVPRPAAGDRDHVRDLRDHPGLPEVAQRVRGGNWKQEVRGGVSGHEKLQVKKGLMILRKESTTNFN